MLVKSFTATLLTIVSDIIARAFNRQGVTGAVALDISKTFRRMWHAGPLHKLKSYGISGQIFAIIPYFLSERRLRVVLYGKSSQEYPVNAGVHQGSMLGPTLPHYTSMNFQIILSAILLPMLRILLSTLKCYQASGLRQQLELTSELESDLQYTADWCRKRLAN